LSPAYFVSAALLIFVILAVVAAAAARAAAAGRRVLSQASCSARCAPLRVSAVFDCARCLLGSTLGAGGRAGIRLTVAFR
jgi:hypothetical protein